MKITASRLSEGNKLFPAEIHIEEAGLTVKIPGFLGGKSTFLSYSDISSVSVDAPMIGYSTIKFNAHGEKVTAHGFTKSEVNQVKAAIDNGKRNAPVNTSSGSGFPTGANQSGGSSGGGFFKFMGDQYNNLNNSVEADRQREQEEKQRVEGKVDDIAQLTFGGTTEEISNQLSHLVTIGNSKPDKKVKSAIVEKMEFGIMKLKGLGANAEADYRGVTMASLLNTGYSRVPKQDKEALSDKVDDVNITTMNNNARKAVINVLQGGKDVSNGSQRWDGVDFIAWGLYHAPTEASKNHRHQKFNQFGTIKISKDLFETFKKNSGLQVSYKSRDWKNPVEGGYVFAIPETVFLDNSGNWEDNEFSYSTNVNTLTLVATAVRGKTIYWKIIK